MAITNPMLPPRAGYVEIEIDGVRQYRSLYASNSELNVDVEPTEADDIAAMLIDHEYRLTLMELGLSEGGEA